MKRLLVLRGALCASAAKRTDELASPVPRQVDGAVSEGVFFRRGFHSCKSEVVMSNFYVGQIMLSGFHCSDRPEWQSVY